jgi:cytochrome c551/c552
MTRFLTTIGIAVLAATGSARAQTTEGDAARGEQLIGERGCLGCHGPGRQRGDVPDLLRSFSRSHRPAYVAGVLWNHALAGRAGLADADLSVGQASDLFAYFASRRFFETPGDAGRGKRVFEEKHCSECHGHSQHPLSVARSVEEWGSLRDPIAFAGEMWNRSPSMLQRCAREGVRFPRFTSRELNDLTVYLANLPASRNRAICFRIGSVETGRAVFQASGCAGCHEGRRSLEKRTAQLTMADISAAFWNHSLDRAENRQRMSYDDMSALVSYLSFLADRRNRLRGRRIFVKKNCAGCHNETDTSVTEFAFRRVALPVAMVAVLRSHAGTMQGEMRRKGLLWTRFTGTQMADLAETFGGAR